LVRVPRSRLEAAIDQQENELVFQVFNRSDGIASLSFSTLQPSAVSDRNGRMWFATERGAIMVDSRSLRLNTQPPPVAIEELLLDGRPVSTGEPFLTSSAAPPVPVTVPPGTHRLEIHYAALSFVAADKLHFRYMLEGLDKDWIDVGERRVAYLQDLKPGRYRLHVRADNNDGIWNDTGAFAEIYIRPHFYQTYWFLSVCLFAAALVGMGAYRLRIKRMQQRERELEELVNQSARELQERKRVENELRRSEDKFAKAFHSSPASMSISSLENGRMIDVNEGFLKLFGFQLDEIVGHTSLELDLWENAAERERVVAILRGHGTARNLEARFRTRGGKILDTLVSAEMVSFAGEDCVLGVVLDITEQKRLEEQLRQAQKMEAVGKLAGGVAHDFNNLLTVIKGYSELVLDGALEADTRSHFERIKEAAGRAAALVSQLLAFSRQQVLQPRAFNINSLVLNMDTMLRRLIGEDIEIVTSTAPDLGPARADPGQIEQVIMNLAVNARDAMPNGGKLTLETANVELNGAFALEHPGAAPGRYAVLAVSDTGIGMDPQIRTRIFEPFFTTKEVGKGTGLGLSMVYGIVKQSGGYISVYSEPGKGSTVKIYLPRADTPAEAAPFEPPAVGSIRGNETILLVEDDVEVRQLARIVLETCGYCVFMVDNPLKVSSVSEHYTGPIHLLVTDVVMPGLSGPELARQLIDRWPAIKVLYMSGYTSEAIVHRGELASGTFFLSKPFTPSSLAAKVREVLDHSSVTEPHVKSR
jgi:PAS domain S-box-containing protein